MSEEKKAKAEKQAEEKPAPASSEGEGKVKVKKISQMTLAEVEQKLKTLEKQMGGFQSDFARHLLARKQVLSQTAK